MSEKLSLSFCIHTRNRHWQLSKTLLKNLRDNFSDRDRVNFVLVDFGSTDETLAWVMRECRSYLDNGFLSLFKAPELIPYKMSLAKNTAQAQGTGLVLTNLDSDNFTGPRGGLHVLRNFESNGGKIVYHQYSGETDGSSGRVSVLRSHFVGVGGYDEQFYWYGYDEHDFVRRVAAKYGVPVVLQSTGRLRRVWNVLRWRGRYAVRYNKTIPNPRPSASDSVEQLTWEEMDVANHLQSLRNLSAGKLVANNGVYGISDLSKFVDGKFIDLKRCETSKEVKRA